MQTPSCKFVYGLTAFIFLFQQISFANPTLLESELVTQPVVTLREAAESEPQTDASTADAAEKFLHETQTLLPAETNSTSAPFVEETEFSFKPEEEQIYLDPEQFIANGPGGVLKEVTKDNNGKVLQVRTETHVFDYVYAQDGKIQRITQSRLERQQQIAGPNLAAGIIPTASSYYAAADYNPSRATNGQFGDTSVGWGSQNAEGQQEWLQVDLGSVKSVGWLKYDSRYHPSVGNLIWQSSFKISGSLDGVTWFEVASRQGLTTPQLFDLQFNPKELRYLRVHDIVSHFPSFAPWWHFAYVNEIQAFATVPTGALTAVAERGYSYQFDASNRIANIHSERIISNGSVFIPEQKYEYVYDVANRIKEIKESVLGFSDPNVNLLAGITPTASSTSPSGGFVPGKATDGLFHTHGEAWNGQSGDGRGEWLQMDMGYARTIDRLVYDSHRDWYSGEFPYQESFKISGSLDGVNWFLLVERNGLTANQIFNFQIDPRAVRYLRVHDIHVRYPPYGEQYFQAYVNEIQAFETAGSQSRREVRKFGYDYDAQGRLIKFEIATPSLPLSPQQNLALGKAPEVTSYYEPAGYVPALATDGKLGDAAVGWAGTSAEGNDWLTIDLGSVKTINRLRYDSRYHPYFGNSIWQESFTISGSADGFFWKPLAVKENLSTPQLFDLLIGEQNVRYIRVHNIVSHFPSYSPDWHYAYVNEIEVYAPLTAPKVTLLSPTLTKQALTSLEFEVDGQLVSRDIEALEVGENFRRLHFVTAPGYETTYFARIEHFVVPNQPAIVSVQPGDRRLFVQERLTDGTLSVPAAFVSKGVNWSPHTAGASENNLHLEYANWYETDLPLMAQMGINVVRVYHDFGTGPEAQAILDAFYYHGIKVIVEVDSPRHGVVADMANISAVVNAYKNHPAILMWSVGNEWDLNRYYGVFSTLQEAAQFTEQAAQLIKTLDPNHAVSTILADPHIPGVHPLSQAQFPFLTGPFTEDIVNTLVPSVDVWGLNLYRGNAFGEVFQQWKSITTKPMFISEFGADSFDHRINSENQTMQSGMDTGLWDETFFELSADRTQGAAIGVLAFEWNDEWWKNGSPNDHTITTEQNGGQPDGHNDEEWFGLVDIHRNPKQGFYDLQNRFLNGQGSVTLNANPVIELTSSFNAVFELDNEVMYSRSGGSGGGRGINVAVLDENTGIRYKEVRNFDTWTNGALHVRFQDMIDYINSLPDGSIISLSIGEEGGFKHFTNGQPWADPYVHDALNFLESLGSTEIRSVPYHGSWGMIFKKGQGKLAEASGGAGTTTSLSYQVSISLDPNAGRREPPVGD